jgi:gamma-glutamyl:cysteine ligase YbdK (ATP-grasp superfamily)/succinylglutamate desuccinylase
MGEEIRTSSFSDADFDRFKKALKEETAILESWFKEKKFSSLSNRAGFEIESWLVDEQLYPASINEDFLKKLNSPLASPELASFNVELNSSPCDLNGDVLTQMQHELDKTWQECKKTAKELHSDIVMVGILPTLDNDVLHLANMSKMKRYRALNREVLHRRKGRPLVFDINGVEHLKVTHRDVMMEAAATSFQIHLQVNLENAVRLFNASIAITGPLLALSANSPYLFGKDLWDETRIPVFEQAVAVGGYDGAAFGPIRRVTFGDSYIRESLFECFKENLEHYPVLLPVDVDNKYPLSHLRLHNGTIWRWNRPLIGFDDSGLPHMRIEQRVVPAGPTTQDAIANAAFYYGAVTALAELDEPIENQIPHSFTRDNFYAAARFGLRSTQRWTNGEDINARELILNKLLPLAHQGLTSLGIKIEDSDKYLGIIHDRVKSGQNGTAWQRSFVKKHGRDMTALTKAYIKNQNSGEPVHRWHHQKVDDQTLALTVLDEIPEGLLQVKARDLHDHLSGPTLIRLQGKRKDVLFVSVLLHGNETSGWDAIRELLIESAEGILPRSLYLFIGNVAAAAEGLRVLDGQQDYNRIWKKNNETAEGEIAAEVLDIFAGVTLFAAVDIHNNTGINPHYACVNELDSPFLHLATLFSRTVVYFRRPDSVLSLALSELCPATTVECGKAEDVQGRDHAKEFINACLHLHAFPTHDVAEHDIDIFHTVAIVKVPEQIDFGIENPATKLNFIGNMDRLNFQELSAGTILAHSNCDNEACLQAINEDGDDVVEQYFSCEKGVLRFSVPLMPSMLTLDEQIIRQDCLCYLMERLDYHKLK